jgi:hypothetical protein
VSLNCVFFEMLASGPLAASFAQLGLLEGGRGPFRILAPPLLRLMLTVTEK